MSFRYYAFYVAKDAVGYRKVEFFVQRNFLPLHHKHKNIFFSQTFYRENPRKFYLFGRVTSHTKKCATRTNILVSMSRKDILNVSAIRPVDINTDIT